MKSYMKGYRLLRSVSVPAGYALYLAREFSSEQKTITSVFKARDGFVEYAAMERFPPFTKTLHYF